jgi:hypothetical protein
LPVRRRAGLRVGGLDAVGDKIEGGAAFHLQRRAWILGQHEHGHMVWRFLAPPALPVVVRATAHGPAKHIPAQDPGANILEAARGEVLVRTIRSLLSSPIMRWKVRVPRNHVCSSPPRSPQWILQALVRACAKTIERDGKAAYFKFGHEISLVLPVWPGPL